MFNFEATPLFLVVTILTPTLAFLVHQDIACPPGSHCRCSARFIVCLGMNLTLVPTFTKSQPLTTTVKLVDLSNNDLRHLPDDSFGTWNFSSVKSLEIRLQSNQLTSIDLDAFRGVTFVLTTLDLATNNLTTLPLALTRLPNLRELFIEKNPLTIVVPYVSRSLGKSLQHLRFTYDSFASWPVEVSYISSLDTITAEGSTSLTIPPTALEGLDSLSVLTIDRLEMVPQAICSLASLSSFTAHLHSDSARMPNCTHALETVMSVSLYHNFSAFPDLFSVFPNVQTLHLNGNPRMIYVADESIPANCSITWLDLSENGLTVVPESAQKCVFLKRLYLSYNNITVIQKHNFDDLPHLYYINLDGNPLQYINRDAFTNLVSLKAIDLYDTTLTTLLPFSKLSPLPYISIPSVLFCTCEDLGWLKGRDADVHKLASSVKSRCYHNRNESVSTFLMTDFNAC